MMKLLRPPVGSTLLDVGCGSGHFSRRFRQAGLTVTGLDPEAEMLAYARRQSAGIDYIEAVAESLPFADHHFDYCSAVTSLCFVSDQVTALQEMWRVSKHGIILGLLNRHSLLYRQKAGHGAYAGARWDARRDVINWLATAGITPASIRFNSAIFFPTGGPLARVMESLLPGGLPWGGFLAVYLDKRMRDASVHNIN
ncbi:class I SAM-dependent methyltransferase [Sulfuriflexus sp.]|uniref:class I SAM-dependent methyltransferase n=1 Tax=Sulfuriflexus sp. TaxID=2015443 RepID=UPI0028CCDB7E|nr:class I SAM-dependent methyltransferase [Sulfuriflexus sp.]MDT8405102.1 class I SAM-dependent methyltransferase [Sulfuriflexus sp.]